MFIWATVGARLALRRNIVDRLPGLWFRDMSIIDILPSGDGHHDPTLLELSFSENALFAPYNQNMRSPA